MVEVLPHGPVASLRPSVLARRRVGVDAEQYVDVRVGRHRGELLARRPRIPRMSVAPPEHRPHALDRRQPPVVAQDGPQLRVHPSLDYVLDLPELGRPEPEGPPAARHRRLGVLGEEPPEELLEPRRRVVAPQRRRRAAGRAPPALGPR